MSPEESLHDTYLKAKRYLVFFSGALLLSVLVGFAASEQNALLGWKLSHPHLASVVIYFGVGYYLAQLALFWDAQPEPAKIRVQHRFDYRLSVLLGVVALYALPARLLLHRYSEIKMEGIQEGDLLENWQAIAAFAALPILAAIPYQLVLRPRIKRGARDVAAQESSTTDLLLSHVWRLVFNPATYARTGGANGSKEILFEPDGTISEGRNNNEHTWRTNGGFLEMLTVAGTVHSRFRVEDDGQRLQHLNDADTVSYRDQYLTRIRPRGPKDNPVGSA